jgi:xanthine dehydrogenase accessory factor
MSEAMSFALEAQTHGEGAVIVTVVANGQQSGPAPGARMVVLENGAAAGTIDSRLDSLLTARAEESLAARESNSRSYRLSDQQAEDVGVQGGDVDVFFEVLALPPKLILVGAGHIAAPLAAIAKLLDFEVSVIDDRPEYASRERFPGADHVLVGPYSETVRGLPVDGDTFIVLVTRGHVHDLACLEEVIASPAAYIGMIGSKRRVRTVISHAREHGVDPAQLQKLHAPIGLDIGSQTPAEIAVAIAAQIISVRRGRRTRSLSLQDRSHV